MFSDYESYDDDDRPACEKCGEPLTADEDGDGVMTAPVYFCEHCGDDDTLHGEQEVKEVPGGPT